MATSPDTSPDTNKSSFLRGAISSTRQILDRMLSTARTHSPISEDKLEAADNAVASVIHSGYQAVKRIAVHGHPSVILSVTGIAAAAPSLPFGTRAVLRNTGLAVALAAVMIYPDHLRSLSAPRPAATPASAQKSCRT